MYGSTVTTGPKTSWQLTFMSGRVPVSTVGSIVCFLRRPPQSKRAPAWTASSIQIDGADRVGFADQRTDIRGVVERVAGFERLHAFDQKIGELSVHSLLNENALHGDAGLARIAEAAGDASVRGIGEVGVAVDDDRRVAPEFENNFLLPCTTLDVPSNRNAAGKADQFDSVVGDKETGVFVGERENVQTAIGPSCLLYALSQEQRAERGLGRWFQDHGASGSDRRSDFMGHEIDGEIERSNTGHRAERKAANDAPASSGKFLPIQGKELAIDAGALLGGNVKSEDGTVDFDARSLDWFSGLLGEGARNSSLRSTMKAAI